MQERGWMTVNLIQTSTNGIADTLYLKAPKRVVFVEYKKPGEVPRALQDYRRGQIEAMGFEYYLVDSLKFPDIR